MGIKDFLKKLAGGSEEKDILKELEGYLTEKRLKTVKSVLEKKQARLEMVKLESSIAGEISYPQVISLSAKVDSSEANSEIRQKAMKAKFEEFSAKAFEILPQYIAQNIHGMDAVKKSVVLQLFAKQPVHLLLLGDPGTGKTDVLRAAFTLSPVSSFGLGSGTSGVGLVATVKGDKIMKGLIPLADKGICCIDELNLMKEESRAGLYNSMEKGFVTYDKGGHHYQFDARVKILATANPKGDKFSGKTIDELREELPFDSALLTRFNLIFFIRKPDLNEFKKIASSIASGSKTELGKGDIEFIKAYVEYISKHEVKDISKPLQKKVVDFIAEIKHDEKKYLIEVSPRLVIGFMRLCKALATIEGRSDVEEKDVDRVKEILRESLEIHF